MKEDRQHSISNHLQREQIHRPGRTGIYHTATSNLKTVSKQSASLIGDNSEKQEGCHWSIALRPDPVVSQQPAPSYSKASGDKPIADSTAFARPSDVIQKWPACVFLTRSLVTLVLIEAVESQLFAFACCFAFVLNLMVLHSLLVCSSSNKRWRVSSNSEN